MYKKFNDNFMNYPEFEFWWLRFSAGNFDLDYDRSNDPKYRTITDLPVDIFKKICKNLGYNYQEKYRFTLRHVCKSFRSLVDPWIPNFKELSIYSSFNGNISLTFDNQNVQYKNWNLALSDLISILNHPKLKLEKIDVSGDMRFVEKLVRRLDSLKIKIRIENFQLGQLNWNNQKAILQFLQGETAEFGGSIDRIFEFIDKISEIDRRNRISKMRFTVNTRSIYMKDATKLVTKFLDCSNLKSCQFGAQLTTTIQLKRNIETLGAKIQTDRPDILHYPIPNSDNFFEIEIQKYGIRIERKSV
ncbi:unnamed protein product [Caenorhabditis nigoni]